MISFLIIEEMYCNIVQAEIVIIKNLCLVFCESTNCHPYSIVSISRYWLKNIVLFYLMVQC